jgi:flavodoxin
MNNLIVYYSRTGMTRKVAEVIKEKTNWDIEEIIDNKNRRGPIGYILSGRDALRKKEANIKEPISNLSEYDIVIIGTPIWSFTVSTPTRTYLNKQKGNFKKVAFFCTMGGSGDAKAFSEMENAAGVKPEKTLALTDKEIIDGSFLVKVDEFIKNWRDN